MRSDKSTFRERHAHAVADDDVVEQTDVDQRERLLDPHRDEFVGLAGLGDAGGMIVRHDERRRIALQSAFDDFSGVHTGTVDRAAE